MTEAKKVGSKRVVKHRPVSATYRPPAAERPVGRIRGCDLCRRYGLPMGLFAGWGMLCPECQDRLGLK